MGGDCELFRIGMGGGTLAEAEAWVHRMHDRFTRFSESSELSHFNASAGGWTAVGGDLLARGPGETGEGWPVGFGDRTVLLRDMGAATSGTTKRMWGPGLHHLIDPRTSKPAATDLKEVSVIAGTAADAEIYAKVAL